VAAGAHTEGSAQGAGAPTPEEVVVFLAAYDDCRASPFTGPEQAAAAGTPPGDGLQRPVPAQLPGVRPSARAKARGCGCCPGTQTTISDCDGDW